MQSASRKGFVDALSRRLVSIFPERFCEMSTLDIEGLVEHSITIAESCGIESKDHIRRFTDIFGSACELPLSDSQPHWMKNILEDDASGPREKLTKLESWQTFVERV